MERIGRQRRKCYKLRQYKRDPVDIDERYGNIAVVQLGLYFFEEPQKQWKKLWKREQKKIQHIVKNSHFNPFQVQYDKKIELKDNGKKILFLDLDQTLVYSSRELTNPEAEIFYKNNRIAFNVRPFCSYFLKQMSKIYDIYIFSSSKKNYALPIARYLDQGRSIIKGVLHRQHCLCVGLNSYLKDLALIGNIDLSNMVIMDNSICSFLLQINNGIPIQSFKGNHNDRALLSAMGILINIQKQKDVRNYLRKTLQLIEKMNGSQQCQQTVLKKEQMLSIGQKKRKIAYDK